MITETSQQYHTREYTLCMERVDKYYVLQSWRRDQGYWGAAKFYQEQAKRWYKRAVIAHGKALDLAQPMIRSPIIIAAMAEQ